MEFRLPSSFAQRNFSATTFVSAHAVSRVVGATCLVLSTGCALVRPEARAIAVEVRKSAENASEVALVVELRNPGDDEIELVQYDYTVTVADGSSYGGRWAALRALPPGQTVTAEIPALLPTSSLNRDATAWRASGTLTYRDPRSFARILYEAGILKSEISFAGSGTTKPEAPVAQALAND